MKRHVMHRCAFTLIELLIVCALILTLAGVTCAVYAGLRSHSVAAVSRVSSKLKGITDQWQ